MLLLLNSDYDQNASGSTVGDKRQWYIQYNVVDCTVTIRTTMCWYLIISIWKHHSRDRDSCTFFMFCVVWEYWRLKFFFVGIGKKLKQGIFDKFIVFPCETVVPHRCKKKFDTYSSAGSVTYTDTEYRGISKYRYRSRYSKYRRKK